VELDLIATLLLLLVVVVLVGLAIALVLRVLQRRRAQQGLAERARTVDPMAPGPLVSDPRRLKPGDVVRLSTEPGEEHLLDGSTAAGERRHWLSVEEGEGGLELVLWDRVSGSDLTPDRAELAVDGTAYRRDERGSARYASTGTTGAAASGTAEYADYLPAGGGDARLSFERFSTGGSWEVSRGQVVLAESLTILHS